MGNPTLNPRVNPKVKPAAGPASPPLLIGKLAAATGVGRDGLRFYESLGLIAAHRGPNGYRQYAAETVDFVRYIKTAQRLGFTLAEIRQHAHALRDQPDQQAAVAAVFAQRVAMVDERIRQLSALSDELRRRIGTTCPMADMD